MAVLGDFWAFTSNFWLKMLTHLALGFRAFLGSSQVQLLAGLTPLPGPPPLGGPPAPISSRPPGPPGVLERTPAASFAIFQQQILRHTFWNNLCLPRKHRHAPLPNFEALFIPPQLPLHVVDVHVPQHGQANDRFAPTLCSLTATHLPHPADVHHAARSSIQASQPFHTPCSKWSRRLFHVTRLWSSPIACDPATSL